MKIRPALFSCVLLLSSLISIQCAGAANSGDALDQPAKAAASKVEDAKTAGSAPDFVLHGSVESVGQFPKLSQRINNLVELAVDRSSDKQVLDSRHHHFSKPTQCAFAATKDLAELATEYKGFEQSSEAADIILGEKLKLKSKSACEFAKQQRRDNAERLIYASLIQLAEGLGSVESAHSIEEIKQGVDKLASLVGPEEAGKTQDALQEWCAAQKLNASIDLAQPLSILEIEQRSKSIMNIAMNNDAMVADIKKRLHKYNGRSSLARFTAKFLNSTLSIAGYSPSIISPAAQVAWGAYICTQGGPEESKLLKEIYLAKRFESRWTTLNDRAKLALNSYNYAVATKNTALLSVAECVISDMSTVPDKGQSTEKHAGADELSTNGDATPAATAITGSEPTEQLTESESQRSLILTNSGLPN
jgi:hypothetical protein